MSTGQRCRSASVLASPGDHSSEPQSLLFKFKSWFGLQETVQARAGEVFADKCFEAPVEALGTSTDASWLTSAAAYCLPKQPHAVPG